MAICLLQSDQLPSQACVNVLKVAVAKAFCNVKTKAVLKMLTCEASHSYWGVKIPTRIKWKHAETDTWPKKINCSWYYIISLVLHKSFPDLSTKLHQAQVIMLWCCSDFTLRVQICYLNTFDMEDSTWTWKLKDTVSLHEI